MKPTHRQVVQACVDSRGAVGLTTPHIMLGDSLGMLMHSTGESELNCLASMARTADEGLIVADPERYDLEEAQATPEGLALLDEPARVSRWVPAVIITVLALSVMTVPALLTWIVWRANG